ncbi:P-loop containing nucleoside triphosphate hydrolase protein [Apiosordaria backusii]|uniref:P-loop containing nucleoside triphosphate hydrolase protein n=1 Tax=Apiosordaria backusii TaxID=314023 RepID=A0AA40EDJ6_9PEZI|nr:P-loop containing nucleoside triphosphate hydrolase protein [Apiosordaria backusii]
MPNEWWELIFPAGSRWDIAFRIAREIWSLPVVRDLRAKLDRTMRWRTSNYHNRLRFEDTLGQAALEYGFDLYGDGILQSFGDCNPSRSNAPDRNPNFTGRSADLKRIYDILEHDKRHTTATRICEISGRVGVGKSQLALEYAHRARQNYSHVFWVSLEQDIRDQYARLAQIIHQNPSAQAPDQAPDQAQRSDPVLDDVTKVIQWIESSDPIKSRRWLLVLDRVEVCDTIKEFLPKSSRGGSILITTRSPSVFPGSYEVKLGALTNTEGAILFLNQYHKGEGNPRRPSPDDIADAGLVSGTVGGLPCLVVHLARTLQTLGISPKDYLCEHPYYALDSGQTIDKAADPGPVYDLYTLETSGGAMYNHLYHDSPNFAWEHPLGLLSTKAFVLSCTIALLGRNSTWYMIHSIPTTSLPVVHELRRHSLIVPRSPEHPQPRANGTRPQTNQLLMEVGLQRHLLRRLHRDPEEFKVAFENAISILHATCPRQSPVQAPSNGNWARIQTANIVNIALHLYDVNCRRDWPKPLGHNYLVMFGEALSDVGCYLFESGVTGHGQALLEQADKSYLAAGGLPSAQANAKTWLAAFHLDAGIRYRRQGIECLVDVFHLRRPEGKGPETPEAVVLRANSYNDLGLALMEYGRYEDAYRYLDESKKLKNTLSWAEQRKLTFSLRSQLDEQSSD